MDGYRTKAMGNRVAIVTGGGGGIGAAGALELARQGAAVVILDPGVGVQGEPLGEMTAAETAKQIVDDGGTARASTVSVTDGDAVSALFDEVVDDFGSLDVVVNAAGVLRFPKLVDASEDDWWAVLDVHVNGYLNVLEAALPLMRDAGYGRIVGFTSGVGLARTSGETLAYGCAKRTVAALTWKLGRCAPNGVAINALSPIAATRMVRGAMVASGAGPRGLDLSAMPQAEAMASAVAYLSSERVGWCHGQVVFSAGSELTVISGPRLLESLRTAGVDDVAASLDTLFPVVLGPAESQQRTTGGSNPRFGAVFGVATADVGVAPARDGTDGPSCLVVTADEGVADGLVAALGHWGWRTVAVGGRRAFDAGAKSVPMHFDEADNVVQRAERTAPIGTVIVVAEPSDDDSAEDPLGWQGLLRTHRATARRILFHAAWTRAVARLAAASGRPVRLVHVVPAGGPASRTAAQAVAQMARSANDTAGVDAYSISLESDAPSDRRALAPLAARLACADDAMALAGAELVVGRGWLGVRRHPAPSATISFGGPEIPPWVDHCLQEAVGGSADT